MLSALPEDFPAAILIVHHVDRSRQTQVDSTLNECMALTAKLAEEGDRPQPGCVYVAPSNHHLLIKPDGTLTLTQSQLINFVRPSIDLLFASVAAVYGDRAIAVVLSGTGRDSAEGVKAIKKGGGTVIIEDPKTAEFSGMLMMTQNTKVVDYVLPLSEIAPAISNLVRGELLPRARERMLSNQQVNELDTTQLAAQERQALQFNSEQVDIAEETNQSQADMDQETVQFEALIAYLRQVRGCDFGGYKRNSLRRRFFKRMQAVNLNSFDEYLDYLEVYPDEFDALFNTVLINVTTFFRDPVVWQYLQHEVIPSLIAQKGSNSPIRIWSAGCSSGEEAYSLAILFAEALGIEEFRSRVKIYATDLDDQALVQARQASYPMNILQDIPEAWRERYFERSSGNGSFRSDLRRCVIFGRHNLAEDAPISRVDLLLCRNTLMYFNAETQSRVLARFNFSLNPAGVLVVGKAEMLLTHSDLFSPINLQHRVFRKVAKIDLRNQLLSIAPPARADRAEISSSQTRLLELGFNETSRAQIILDIEQRLALANMVARRSFGLRLQDIGRPFKDLELSYRPTELRAHLDQVVQDQQPITLPDVIRYLPNNEEQYLEVQLIPLKENNGQLVGISITFTEVSRYHKLQVELQRSAHELETLNEELQASNEELETANEELQSTNEELETTNEELQSANEEMETMNEELQSGNEELQTMNEELRLRTKELNQGNTFLNSILTSLKGGVVVVDQDFKVLKWNQAATNLWGLREDEVQGRSLLSLDIGLPVRELREPLQQCLIDRNCPDIVLAAINRLGRRVQCRISLHPLINFDRVQYGVILLIETEPIEH
ncbi:MAG: hypothetical protein Kow00121_62640 [Elainellaceae cyanobacterium]